MSRERRKRFKNELAFLRRRMHPRLVSVIDHGQSAAVSGPFYVMPRYDGSFRDLIRHGIDPSQVIDIVGQMPTGVEAARMLVGAVHRDRRGLIDPEWNRVGHFGAATVGGMFPRLNVKLTAEGVRRARTIQGLTGNV